MVKPFATMILAAGLLCAAAAGAQAQKRYDPGVSDTEIRLGNVAPYSGPASAYSTIARAEAAYFAMVNDQGGINGRKVKFISYDDAYSPPKSVEQVRKLVEGDEVFLLVGTVGTAPNIAIQKYVNAKKVPQVFVASGSSRFSEPETYPYTLGWGTTYRAEGIIYARYLLANKPDAKIAILYQNDDLGKELAAGLKEGLGDKSKAMVVAEVPYELSSPTIDSEIRQLRSSGADVLFSAATPKFVAQEIRKIHEIGWTPLHIVAITGSYIAASIKPAGFDKAQGIISSNYWKDPTDSQWANDPAMGEWRAWMDKYFPDGDKNDNLNVCGYIIAQNMVAVLKQAGDTLTRENVMSLLRNMKDLEFGLLLPGIKVNTGPGNPTPVSQTQLMRIKNEQWELFGPVISSSETR